MEFVLFFIIIFILFQILEVPVLVQLLIALWAIRIAALLCVLFFIISFLFLLISSAATLEFVDLTRRSSFQFWIARYKYKDTLIYNIFPTDQVLVPLYKKQTKKMRVVRIFKQYYAIDGYAVATIWLGLLLFSLISFALFTSF